MRINGHRHSKHPATPLPHTPDCDAPYESNRGLAQAYRLRDLSAFEALNLANLPANSLQERAAKAKAIQALASVWNDACDRIRILRGKGLPKPVESKRKSRNAPPWLPPAA